ncbi:MAG TPA: hypothetical protein VK731_11785, partial [Candidatus Cybelea sp.]|nr:hypothetical protein [Candidatus Cybelea sp.]
KPTRPTRPDLLDINLSIHSTTLARVGIFVAVVAVLLVIKHYSANRTAGQGIQAPISAPPPQMVSAPPVKTTTPVTTALDPKQLNSLVGDGPTFILAVPNLTHFALPIDSISRFQYVLYRYDRQDPGALPIDIRLEVNKDRWDFPPGASMKVAGSRSHQFSASLGESQCLFDYAAWMDKKETPLDVQANLENVTRAFSIHFGFSSPTNGDPFRLLIVNENNPPSPLHLARRFLQEEQQSLSASLADSMRDCLFTNFHLLASSKWQLQPFLKTRQCLYKDWPINDRPAFGCELDFKHIGQRLQTQRRDLQARLDDLNQPLARPLGKTLGLTNDNLKSFLTFSPSHQTPGRFLEYLSKLKKSAPDKTWIKQWKDRPDSDQPEEISVNLQELYDLWRQKQPQDQSALTATNKSETTNYFFFAWHQLVENRKERDSMQDELEAVEQRLVQLDQVAYIGLMIVDPYHPGTGLEMIRFE